jgi:uncharacterized membrane protein
MDYEKWCKRCKNYKLTRDRGIICNLTNEKPNFSESCDLFELDEIKEEKRLKNTEKEKEINEEIKNHLIMGILTLLSSIGIVVYMFFNWNEMNNYVFVHRLTGVKMDPRIYFILILLILVGLSFWRFNEIRRLKMKTK